MEGQGEEEGEEGDGKDGGGGDGGNDEGAGHCSAADGGEDDEVDERDDGEEGGDEEAEAPFADESDDGEEDEGEEGGGEVGGFGRRFDPDPSMGEDGGGEEEEGEEFGVADELALAFEAGGEGEAGDVGEEAEGEGEEEEGGPGVVLPYRNKRRCFFKQSGDDFGLRQGLGEKSQHVEQSSAEAHWDNRQRCLFVEAGVDEDGGGDGGGGEEGPHSGVEGEGEAGGEEGGGDFEDGLRVDAPGGDGAFGAVLFVPVGVGPVVEEAAAEVEAGAAEEGEEEGDFVAGVEVLVEAAPEPGTEEAAGEDVAKDGGDVGDASHGEEVEEALAAGGHVGKGGTALRAVRWLERFDCRSCG